ncbi:MAG: HIT domain-containing protein [Acidimicrobiales bacterium]|nr:HIT domain-containing protein [Acidimicrobiales bacterium]
MATSIDVPVGDRCAFCDYLNGARPYTVLRRRDLSAILVTREQRGRSHVLVVPTSHRQTILDLPPDEACAVMQDVVEIARAIEATEQPEGLAIWQNNGLAADQTIPHVHFHVAATLAGGGTERGHVDEISVADTDAIARRLRSALQPGL